MATALLREVAESVVWWWEHLGHGKAVLTEIDDRVDIQLLDDEGEDFSVGSYADAGVSLWEVGTVKDERGEDVYLVRVNSVVMQGLGKSIVGWAIGMD